ncbi:MAG: hypothetical protein LIP09_02255 [Bacteroidales bacterium]|nr:hypothetical protein [Bacteroidales bacterium]
MNEIYKNEDYVKYHTTEAPIFITITPKGKSSSDYALEINNGYMRIYTTLLKLYESPGSGGSADVRYKKQ